MIIFLSHYDRDEAERLTEQFAEVTGANVVSNHTYQGGQSDPDKRADWRMSQIENSDVFVFFASPPGKPQLIRSIELGFAIGYGVPVAFIGNPRNSYHRFGDIFNDASEFLAAWTESQAAKSS